MMDLFQLPEGSAVVSTDDVADPVDDRDEAQETFIARAGGLGTRVVKCF